MHPLLLLTAATLLVPSATPVGPLSTPTNPGIAAAEGFDFLYGCHPDGPGSWSCLSSIIVWNPNIVFFRWDFDGRGTWDTPFGVDTAIYYRYTAEGVWRICAQAWDGITVVDGQPAGPIICKGLVTGGALSFQPGTWDRSSTGAVFASWDPPAGFLFPTDGPRFVAVYTVPPGPINVSAVPVFRSLRTGISVFHVDRAEIVAAYGPGQHVVYMLGEWGGGRFFTLPATITIL